MLPASAINPATPRSAAATKLIEPFAGWIGRSTVRMIGQSEDARILQRLPVRVAVGHAANGERDERLDDIAAVEVNIDDRRAR